MSAQTDTVVVSAVPAPTPRVTEWVAHHLATGFETVVLAVPQDQADDPCWRALAMVPGVALLAVSAAGARFQRQAIRALRQADPARRAEWVLYLDPAEFLCVREDPGALGTLLGRLAGAGADAVSIPTRSFGCPGGGGAVWPDSVTAALTGTHRTDTDRPLRRHLRCLFRRRAFGALNRHRPAPAPDTPAPVWLTASGRVCAQPAGMIGWVVRGDLADCDLVQINRYPMPSPAEFLRNAVLDAPDTDDAAMLLHVRKDWRLHDHAEVEDVQAQMRWPETEAKLAQMRRASPALAAAEAALWHSCRQHCAALMATPLGQGFQGWIAAGMAVPPAAPAKALAPAKRPEPEAPGEDIPALWMRDLCPGSGRTGSYERLQNHALCLVERDTRMLWVSFDNLGPVNDLSLGRDPWAYRFIRDLGQSHLGIFAMRKDWYRDAEFIATLEHWAATRIPGRFGHVVLTGASMGAFAAMAFAPLFPGCRVVAFSPQSTLDRALVPWETRYGMGRAQDWSLPYGDAASGVRAAEKAYVFHDPYLPLDHRHIRRLAGANVVTLKTWYSDHFPPVLLRRMDRLKAVMLAAGAGTLSAAEFYRLYRERRYLPWYMRAMTRHAQSRNHPLLETRIRPAFRALRMARQAGGDAGGKAGG